MPKVWGSGFLAVGLWVCGVFERLLEGFLGNSNIGAFTIAYTTVDDIHLAFPVLRSIP